MIKVLLLLLVCCEPIAFSYAASDPVPAATDASVGDAGLFAKSLWFLQFYGEPSCSNPKNDLHVKSVLAKALVNDRELSLEELDGLINPAIFQRHAGIDSTLNRSKIDKALEAAIPATRYHLNPDLRKHGALLTTSFDMIDREHVQTIEKLGEWIADRWQPDVPLHVMTTCTGNSRRSILGATMGNFAAAYFGFDNVHFHSGGTKPTAFNKRTIATLKEIGFQIEPTGQEAARGDPQIPNPIYRVVWGNEMELLEFSKMYFDKSNPESDFAVLLVCAEADTECQTVPGAALRLSMPLIDPKLYDDGVLEAKKYAERRDDMGRIFLAAMANARRRIHDPAGSFE
jgi:arsenate reductase (thioredoxin)